MLKSALVVGCGFVGLPLARLLHSSGWNIQALTASHDSAARLQSEPFVVSAVDISDPHSIALISEQRFNAVIHCASSGKGGVPAYKRVYLQGTKNLLTAFRCDHFIFAGSTSIYVQVDGSWVDEASETVPTRETGQILLKTEKLVLQANGTVGRLAGLYGPGRCVLLRKLLTNEAIIEGEGEQIMNMIHRNDAANALFFLAEKGLQGVFNIVDDYPVTQLDWYTSICTKLAKPLPPFGPRNLERKRGWTNKRVSNKKLRSLGWTPGYPTFLHGFESC